MGGDSIEDQKPFVMDVCSYEQNWHTQQCCSCSFFWLHFLTAFAHTNFWKLIPPGTPQAVLRAVAEYFCHLFLVTFPGSRWVDGSAMSRTESIRFLLVALWTRGSCFDKLLFQVVDHLVFCVHWENCQLWLLVLANGFLFFSMRKMIERSTHDCTGWDFWGVIFLPSSQVLFTIWIALLFKDNIMLSKTYSLDIN